MGKRSVFMLVRFLLLMQKLSGDIPSTGIASVETLSTGSTIDTAGYE